MTNNDRILFSKCFSVLSEIYQREISAPLIKFYFELLIEFDIDDINKAIHAHTRDTKHGAFFPKPADIIRHIPNSTPQDFASDALTAWESVMVQFERVGPYAKPVLNNITLRALRALGGWRYLCSLSFERLMWVKKEFITVYENISNTEYRLALSHSNKNVLVEHQNG